MTILKELKTRNRTFGALITVHALLLLVSAILFFWDTRLLGGVSLWTKPIKFDLSIIIYGITLAWVLAYLDDDFMRRISRGIAFAMVIETVFIGLQAARGVKSHFNIATPWDGAIFSIMGLAITYNTYLVFQVARRFFKQPPAQLPLPYLKGIQLGLISLLLGSFMGGYMSSQTGHAVGLSDGGEGLPFLNWSTQGGDLRPAHFFGLHGIQVLMILGACLSSTRASSWFSQLKRVWMVQGAFVIYTVFNLALFIQAMMGFPFIRL